jgi:hypothetical protein
MKSDARSAGAGSVTTTTARRQYLVIGGGGRRPQREDSRAPSALGWSLHSCRRGTDHPGFRLRSLCSGRGRGRQPRDRGIGRYVRKHRRPLGFGGTCERRRRHRRRWSDGLCRRRRSRRSGHERNGGYERRLRRSDRRGRRRHGRWERNSRRGRATGVARRAARSPGDGAPARAAAGPARAGSATCGAAGAAPGRRLPAHAAAGVIGSGGRARADQSARGAAVLTLSMTPSPWRGGVGRQQPGDDCRISTAALRRARSSVGCRTEL